ncbi:MAG TPA: transcription termination/antitermination NusG family protein [Tepidisphaeraceae bacterium]|jgi:transcription antitermination factor NusG
MGESDAQHSSSRDESLLLPNRHCGDWFVLRTRARQEKILAADLGARKIGCFLPLLRVHRTYCGRRIQVELPMFPCYMFLRGSVDDTYYADRSGRVAQIIPVTDQHRLDFELSSLARVLESDTQLDPFPYLKKGMKVIITAGPLKGLQGLIEDKTRKQRLILQIEALGQAVSLEVDAAVVNVME